MKKYSTITRKGQVTIPLEVREKLELDYGEKVEFTLNEKDEVILKPAKTDLNDIYGALQQHKPEGSHEEHRRLAREWAAEKRERI